MTTKTVPPSSYITSVCNGRMVVRIFIMSQALAILLSMAPGMTDDKWIRLGLTSLFIHWVALMTTLTLCLLRNSLSTFRPIVQAQTTLLILLLITAVISYFAYIFLELWGWRATEDLAGFIVNNLIVALLVGLLGIQFFALHFQHTQSLEAKSKAELTALHARIKPHFIFNCLNVIAEVAITDGKKAEKLILNLASLLRAALKIENDIYLADEIELCKKYLALEKIRLGDRLQVEWSLPDELPQLLVPGLVLQPIIENAVQHGIESLKNGGVIKISVQEKSTSLEIVVINDFDDLDRHRINNGTAIDNINRRLFLYFNGKATLVTDVKMQKFTCTLTLPFQGNIK